MTDNHLNLLSILLSLLVAIGDRCYNNSNVKVEYVNQCQCREG